MVEIDQWQKLDKSLFTDEVTRISVDTRDFHCIFNTREVEPVEDYETLKKYHKRFFFTIDEVFSVLERLYNKSGGEASWRMLSFKENGNWFKYLRIHKTDLGYVIGSDFTGTNYVFKRSFWLEAEIENTHPNTY